MEARGYNYIEMDQNGRQQNQQQSAKLNRFYLGSRERYIIISSNFDSGNIRVVKQLSDFQFRLECCEDGTFTGRQVNSKSWFYFQVSGFPRNTRGKFLVGKLQALSSIFYSKYSKCYRPVCRVNGQQWRRVEGEVPLSLRENGDLECTIQHLFQDEEESVEFAYCYPYQYSRLLRYLTRLESFSGDSELYFHKEVLVESPQGRPVHLLTITSQEVTDEKEALFQESLFPEKTRPFRFKKPVVMINARVHPGETPASFAMQGVIDFLTNKQDLRAQLLRKMFVFMVVPMINVDGVFHGHFRMDTFGKNLNRFYLSPDRNQQPAIFAIKQLATHLTKDNRLSFYFDLHGHNAKKGCFIYGNAFSDFVQQVESQVFCKLFSINHSGFEYQSCNFTEKHMNAKDRFQDLTKEGCGRVVMHKIARIIHSYSLECGILAPNHPPADPCPPSNPEFKVANRGFVREAVEEGPGTGERLFDGSVLFTEESYRNLGKNLLVSILDVFDKNPYSRVYNSRYKSPDMLRRVTAFQIFHSAQRFRMFQRFIFGKVRNINVLIQQIMNNKIHYKQLYNCCFAEDSLLRDVDWPRNIQGLAKARPEPSRLRKLKSISETKLGAAEEEILRGAHRDASCKVIEEPQQEQEGEEILQMTPSEGDEAQQEPIQIGTKDEEDNSDHSEVQETEMNHEILLMCENEKEEKEILSKIMHNNFNQKDYEQIQEKFKHKNSQEDEDRLDKISNISFSHTENTKKYNKATIVRQNSANRDHQYRLTKRTNIINTQDFYTKHKHRPNKPMPLPPDEKSTINHSIDDKIEVIEIKKLSAAEEFRKNIYDSIKQEIKDSLRRQYERKKQKERLESKLIDSFRFKKHHRFKDPTGYLSDPKQMRSKVRLPSLGSNMYIITTSTRLINKN